MNIVMPQRDPSCPDAELVALCLKRDRDAFAFIVERYQNLLCSLAYGHCGDLGRSEDLAQETFLIAWRKLPELQSPDKLKAWLCSILRNLLHNAARAQTRDPLSAASAIDDDLSSNPDPSAPSDQAMTNEEQALMWTVIRGLPENYREPLILFYRSGESTSQVAQALDLSEEAVRQRLARGRALVGERLAHLVESGLRRSAPARAFTLAVLAALPASSASAAVAGTSIAAGESGTALKSAGLMAKFAAIAANLVSVSGGVLGLVGHTLNTRSRGERRFVTRASLAFLLWGAALPIGYLVLSRSGFHCNGEWSKAILLALGWLALAAPLDAYAIWMALHQKKIRSRDKDHPDYAIETARLGYKLSMYGAMSALAFGTTGWLMIRAAHAGVVPVSLLFLLAAAASFIFSEWAVRRPTDCAQALIYLLWSLAAINLVTVGLFWDRWGGTDSFSSGPLLLLVAVFFASIRAGWWIKQHFLKTAHLGRDSLISLIVFALLMLAGAAFLRQVNRWETSEIEDVQAVLHEIEPDGSISFRGYCWSVNHSATELRQLQFVSSVSSRVDRLLDNRNRPLQLTTTRDGDTLQYTAMFHEPVPAGSSFSTTAEGTLGNKPFIRPNGIAEFTQAHWPANNATTLRIERYRLPPGAMLLDSDAPHLTSRRLPDQRLELRIAKVIPPNESIHFVLRYKCATLP